MRPDLQRISKVLFRPGTRFIEGSRLACGCEVPFGPTIAQAQRRGAQFRACPTHGGPRSRPRPPRVCQRPPASPGVPRRAATPTPPASFDQAQRTSAEQDAASRKRDRDRLHAQSREEVAGGLAAALSAAVRAALHPCGTKAHEDALAELERGLRVAGRIR